MKLKHGNLESYRTLIDVRDAMKSYWLAEKRGKREKFIILVVQILYLLRIFKYFN